MVNKIVSGGPQRHIKKQKKMVLGHSQRSPKDILKKYSTKWSPGQWGPSPGPGPRRRGPGPGPGTAPWARAWARDPLSRRPFFEYFLSMSFGDLWECPRFFCLPYLLWASSRAHALYKRMSRLSAPPAHSPIPARGPTRAMTHITWASRPIN